MRWFYGEPSNDRGAALALAGSAVAVAGLAHRAAQAIADGAAGARSSYRGPVARQRERDPTADSVQINAHRR